jgi:hypothetical protein
MILLCLGKFNLKIINWERKREPNKIDKKEGWEVKVKVKILIMDLKLILLSRKIVKKDKMYLKVKM